MTETQKKIKPEHKDRQTDGQKSKAVEWRLGTKTRLAFDMGTIRHGQDRHNRNDRKAQYVHPRH